MKKSKTFPVPASWAYVMNIPKSSPMSIDDIPPMSPEGRALIERGLAALGLDIRGEANG